MTEEQETEKENLSRNEANVKYLLSATNHLTNMPSNALRCHWNILLADFMEMKNIAFSKREKKDQLNCMYCLCPWRNGSFSVRVLPKPNFKKKSRKLLRKKNEGRKLSKVEKNLSRIVDSRSTVVLNCKICHKSSKFKISQILPSPKTVNVDDSITLTRNEHNEECKMKKKKRRKKKSKKNKSFSGLNPEVIKHIHGSATSNNTQNKYVADNDNVKEVKHKHINNVNINNTQSRKRKVDDVITKKLEPEPKKQIKLNPKKDIVVNPSQKAPQIMKNKKSSHKYLNVENFLHPDIPQSSSNQNEKMINKQINITQNEKTINKNKKKNLSKWKKLIADEEANQPKSSSLKDFLSSL